MRERNNVLFAFYDLEVSPVSFDLAKFLIMAEWHRLEQNLDSLHLVIVPAKDQLFRTDDPFSDSTRNWRMQNIMMPLSNLMASCDGTTVCINREQGLLLESMAEKRVFPENYTVTDPRPCYSFSDIALYASLGRELPSLTPPKGASAFAKRWIAEHTNGRKVISITLREMDFQTNRNSNIENWLEFIDSLDSDIYLPVILRDTERIFEIPDLRFEKLLCFDIATLNIPLRMAFYDQCYLNMLVSNGPMELLAFNLKSRFSLIKFQEKAHIVLNCLPPGEQLPMSGPLQKISWQNDQLDVIKTEFEALVERIEKPDDKVKEFLKRERFLPSEIPLINLTNFLSQEGNVTLLEWIIEHLCPSMPDLLPIKTCLRHLCQALKANKNWPELIRQVKNNIEQTGPDIKLQIMEAEAEFYLNRPEDALALIKQVLAEAPENIYALSFTAAILQLLGDLDEGERILTEAWDRGVHHHKILDRLSKIYKEQGHLNKAIEIELLLREMDG